MCALQAGKVFTLNVEREAPFGFYLSDGEDDVLLHHSEIPKGHDITIEEQQTVFLYTDHEGRLAATLTIPKLAIDQYDWLDVVETHRRYGAFVSIGTKKDVLVSKDDLPEDIELWPNKGDRLYCQLEVDKKGRLFAKRATFDVIQEQAIEATAENFNQNVQGTVYHLLSEGTAIFTDEGFMGFNHETERQGVLRLGQRIEGRIIEVKADGTVNLSLKKRAHEAMDTDAEKLLSYLQNRGGAMPYWDKSGPDIIQRQFKMSKAAFKRALGRLMKQGTVYQEEGWTYLKQQEKQD
ncbi:putative RNA-binding protein (virulence factor B family) [Pullulanibacillus pueri]|uniref:S1 motif domain-containing protein n=1 Tax=Pullulanibacillus pueri TaxID=1437324 RepID=A0A8J2ZXF6_9BACL|nr:S1-like domain-containing RNA-binding protein [Pullulanibacillus pueri]MBM7682926.1 putative RNA-binding protein (virulence factor B family) [Pullulanibacillus pueri]GGH84767.1 hypothetical protein GCM10007096_28610 [Pullulanibacillus pueri]